MPALREIIKRSLPPSVRQAVIATREKFSPPPREDIVLHGYRMVPDANPGPRLNLLMPTLEPALAFGGMITALDVFFEIAKRAGVDMRVIRDDQDAPLDRSVVDRRAQGAGVDAQGVEVVPRTADTPELPVRALDVFLSHNWWTTLNIRQLILDQAKHFGGEVKPYLYLIQDYEPSFYPFSSTHMTARAALDARQPCWSLFNSSEIYDYFLGQGHATERAFVFEPKLLDGLRPFLDGPRPAKAKRILVYGRPSIPRNCYPAVEKALKLWTQRYPQFADWDVVSAGLPHPPMPIGAGRAMRSLGKLPLDGYAELLLTTGVGLSLMASPHPSYPPLEMAHFGVRTITNTYASKDLSRSHENILSVPDIMPDTIAAALAEACRTVETDPDAGWRAKGLRPSFLDTAPFPFLDDLVGGLKAQAWS